MIDVIAFQEKKLNVKRKQFDNIVWSSRQTLQLQLARLLVYMLSPAQSLAIRVFTLQVAHVEKARPILNSVLQTSMQVSTNYHSPVPKLPPLLELLVYLLSLAQSLAIRVFTLQVAHVEKARPILNSVLQTSMQVSTNYPSHVHKLPPLLQLLVSLLSLAQSLAIRVCDSGHPCGNCQAFNSVLQTSMQVSTNYPPPPPSLNCHPFLSSWSVCYL